MAPVQQDNSGHLVSLPPAPLPAAPRDPAARYEQHPSAEPTPRTHVVLLVADRYIRIVNAITGELLRELTVNPDIDYQPQHTSREQ
jgi:hypothetical protein